MRPLRIQRRRNMGWRMPENTVCVDRSTGFGNPFPVIKCHPASCGIQSGIWQVGTWDGPEMWFSHSAHGAQELSVEAYKFWVDQLKQETLRERARLALRGKNISCWCRLCARHKDGRPFDEPCDDCAPCHVDILGPIANAGEMS